MILFLQKTWFLWSFLATLATLRWFHLSSSRVDKKALEACDSAKEEVPAASKQVPS